MSISLRPLNLLSTTILFSLSSAVLSQEISLIDPVNSKVVKATVIALSSAEFTRAPVTEGYLAKHGCRYETSAPEKINELKELITKNVHLDLNNTAEPSNLRTGIYLQTADGATYRYLFNASGASEEIKGGLQLGYRSRQIKTDTALMTGILSWAGPDTSSQKFSKTCF